MVSGQIVLAAIAVSKNEGLYLVDWIEWHRRLGVSKFLIYDACTDPVTFKALEPYCWSGLVSFMPATGHPIQYQAYWNGLNLLKGIADWVAIMDIDEFWNPLGIEDPDLTKFLGSMPPHYGGIGVPWHCFGTSDSDVYEPVPVWKRIVKRVDYEGQHRHSKHIKSIVRPECVTFVNDPHWIQTRPDAPTYDLAGRPITISEHPAGFLPTDKLVINHYVTKTSQEWEQKFARGSADSGPDAHNARKYDDFKKHVAACTREDTSIWNTARKIGLM